MNEKLCIILKRDLQEFQVVFINFKRDSFMFCINYYKNSNIFKERKGAIINNKSKFQVIIRLKNYKLRKKRLLLVPFYFETVLNLYLKKKLTHLIVLRVNFAKKYLRRVYCSLSKVKRNTFLIDFKTSIISINK